MGKVEMKSVEVRGVEVEMIYSELFDLFLPNNSTILKGLDK